jgi:two-component system, response regulator RegA
MAADQLARVLLVEDDLALRKQLRFSLENRFSLFEADAKREALEILEHQPIDVAILDLGLPPQENIPAEGFEVLRKCLTQFPCKTIILTGQKTEGNALESIKLGAFDYLLKPISTEMILFAIERALLFKEVEEEFEKKGVKRVSFDVEVGNGLQPLRDEAGKHIIMRVLRDTHFNIHKSSRILGVKRESLYYFVRKFGLKRNHED